MGRIMRPGGVYETRGDSNSKTAQSRTENSPARVAGKSIGRLDGTTRVPYYVTSTLKIDLVYPIDQGLNLKDHLLDLVLP